VTWPERLQALLRERQATHALAANGNMPINEYRRRLRVLEQREHDLYTQRVSGN